MKGEQLTIRVSSPEHTKILFDEITRRFQGQNVIIRREKYLADPDKDDEQLIIMPDNGATIDGFSAVKKDISLITHAFSLGVAAATIEITESESDNDLLRVPDVVEILNCTKDELQLLCSNGTLSHYNLGSNGIRITRGHVQQFLNERFNVRKETINADRT